MHRVALIIFYTGPLPGYFQYFSDSLKRNTDSPVDVFLFNDHISSPIISGNLKMIPLTLEEFNKITSQKLDITVNADWGYKISEFRPAFGLIFEDYLKEYDFWGYCDLDIIFGKISYFITEEILSSYDVVTASEIQMVGHFSLFRNNELINNLFRKTEDYIKIFTDMSEYYNFDESCRRFYGRPLSFSELEESNQLASIYDIVMNFKDEFNLKVYMNPMVREEPPFKLTYQDGQFFDLNTQKEFLYFHFVKAKLFYLFHFYIPPMQHLPEEFSIVTGGIIPGSPGSKLSKLRWSFWRYLFISQYYLQKIWSKLSFKPKKTLSGWERKELNEKAISSSKPCASSD